MESYGIEVHNLLSNDQIKKMCEELVSTNTCWAWPKFNSNVINYIDRPSIVIGLKNNIKFYGYSNAITYDVIPFSQMPVISKTVRSVSSMLKMYPTTCHIVLYVNEDIDFPYHTDLPLVEGMGFFVIRLGYSRPVEFKEKRTINPKEGEIYVVRHFATNIKHRVAKVTKENASETMNLENPIFLPVPGKFINVALVCRNIPLRNRYAYEGDESIFISYNCWNELITATPPIGELPSSAPPIELIPNVGHRIFDKKNPYR